LRLLPSRAPNEAGAVGSTYQGEATKSDKALWQRLLPYEANFQQLRTWRRAEAALLYAICILSVMLPILESPTYHKLYITKYLPYFEFLNYLLIIGYYVITIVTETFLYPAAARRRRLGFVDNSLGAKFLGKDLTGYFSNDPIKPGPYRLVVNCFENCFFTYNIARAMTPMIVAKNAILASAFLTIAYFGIRNSLIGLPILQILLSSIFITELVHHLNFIAKLHSLLGRFTELFTERNIAATKARILPHAILLLLEYETTLAYNKSPLSDRIYLRDHDRLTKEWEELKSYYGI
jgi:hypothetical protein